MSRNNIIKSTLLVLGVLLATSPAFSCPTIEGFVNYNCDQVIKIAFVGDSIVSGYGDERNNNKGGYVKRIQKQFPFARVTNDGVPGITTSRLIRLLKSEIRRKRSSRYYRKAYGADLVILDVGRNDYWDVNQSSSRTARNVKRISNILRRKLGKNGVAPYVIAASLLPTNRGFQSLFISAVNYSLQRMSDRNLHLELDFSSMPNNLLAGDGLHPTSKGYAWLANLIEDYIQGSLQDTLLNLRVDDDADGIYDIFELNKFGTNPELIDTDGDGITDGEEVFELHSDPLDPLDPVQEILISSQGL